ncbi:MAG: prepilin peptidase [Phycisphaeraceae bacterium]
MPHLFWLILVTCYGACVGSFLNVVIYRLPERQSLIHPGSHCPKCGHKLAWWDNIPILAWLWLRGKCRYCKTPISIQYPIIEAVCAALFAGLYGVYYFTELRPEIFHHALPLNGLELTWPAFALHLVMIAALLAATMIDARLYIIPLSIPWLVTVLAVLWLPVAVGMGWMGPIEGLVPQVASPAGLGMALGGVAGLAAAVALLQTGMMPRSFDDVEEQVTDPAPPDEFMAHPHPRREVLKESPFLLLPAVGVLAGYLLFPDIELPAWLRVLGGVLAGYLVGAALVWGTRILGTLGFGKEAMGLGDVHLLAAIGAVLGPWEAVFTFFLAPFFGLFAALAMAGVAQLLKGQVRVIPYGPYLAGAALVVMVLREPLFEFFWYRVTLP